MCHSGIPATVEGVLPIGVVEGALHEAAGRIAVIGEGVEGLGLGQRGRRRLPRR